MAGRQPIVQGGMGASTGTERALNPAAEMTIKPGTMGHKTILQQLLAAKREVELLRSADEALLKALAAAGTAQPAVVARKAAIALKASESALLSSTMRCTRLSTVLGAVLTGQPITVAPALRDELRTALSTSTALGMFQQSALLLVQQHMGGVRNADPPTEPAAKRAKRAPVETAGGLELQLLRELIARVALISGKTVSLQRQPTQGCTAVAEGTEQGIHQVLEGSAEGFVHVAEAVAKLIDCAQILLEIEGVVCFIITLGSPRRLEVLRVAAFSDDERCEGSACGWGFSDHSVYKHLSEVAMRALHHYNERGEKAAAALQTLPGSTPGEQPEGTEGTLQPQLTDADIAAGARICRAAAIEDLLLWLASYEDLFSRECEVGKVLLSSEPIVGSLFPPLLRPYRCLRPALISAAQPGATRKAFHVHAAPLEEL